MIKGKPSDYFGRLFEYINSVKILSNCIFDNWIVENFIENLAIKLFYFTKTLLKTLKNLSS